MNTFWLKIAGIAVAVVGLIIAINVFTGNSKPKTKRPPKTISDQWAEDERKLRAEPQFKEPPVSEKKTQTSGNDETLETVKPQFKKLSLEDDIQAQRLWEWVVNQRKMGRLPIMGYKKMVDACREIIQRWPESEYAFKAKRALADIPVRYRKMYKITDEEIDLGNLK